MEPYAAAIITGLGLTLVASLVIFVLIVRNMRNQRKWERIAEDQYRLGRDEAAQLLRDTCDKITRDREQLEGRTEKELLIQTLLTLDSYSRRMDRLEEKLRCISHYKTYMGDIQGKAQKLSQGFAVLEQSMTAAASGVDALKSTTAQTGQRLEELTDTLSGMDRLHTAVTRYASQLQNTELTLEFLQEKTAGIVAQMESVVSVCDQSPEKRMKNIEMEITGLSLLINSLHDSVEELMNRTRQSSGKAEAGEMVCEE